jgi:hypothetical protein
VRKAASLLALEEQRTEVTLRDVVIALIAAEEWLENLFFIAEQISASMWAREVDEVEQFVLAKGGQVAKQVLFRKFASRQLRDLLQQLESLKAQGRVTDATDNGRQVYRAMRAEDS